MTKDIPPVIRIPLKGRPPYNTPVNGRQSSPQDIDITMRPIIIFLIMAIIYVFILIFLYPLDFSFIIVIYSNNHYLSLYFDKYINLN